MVVAVQTVILLEKATNNINQWNELWRRVQPNIKKPFLCSYRCNLFVQQEWEYPKSLQWCQCKKSSKI